MALRLDIPGRDTRDLCLVVEHKRVQRVLVGREQMHGDVVYPFTLSGLNSVSAACHNDADVAHILGLDAMVSTHRGEHVEVGLAYSPVIPRRARAKRQHLVVGG